MVLKPATQARKPILIPILLAKVDLHQLCRFDGLAIVERSIAIGEPIVYASVNYR